MGASANNYYKSPNLAAHPTPLEVVGHWLNHKQIYCLSPGELNAATQGRNDAAT